MRVPASVGGGRCRAADSRPAGQADRRKELTPKVATNADNTESEKVRLEIDGPVAVITNDNPAKHNAFDDDMDVQLFEILTELKQRPEVRAVIWRGEGKSFS